MEYLKQNSPRELYTIVELFECAVLLKIQSIQKELKHKFVKHFTHS